MEQKERITSISVLWRGKKFTVEVGSGATLRELGHELQKSINVKPDTMRLIIPQSSNRSSKLLSPFSDVYMHLTLQETSFVEGKTIRVMGSCEAEVDEMVRNAKVDQRILGFDEEEKRLRQRMLYEPNMPFKLPQGTYIFSNFRALEIPGMKLNPPASEALKIMHMLATDPGITAIMNKHHWRVGFMTEMAPIGYVGVTPKCILGFNKNFGEEISLRLRTDDLKGFRKYMSIKKTLLHELAHMVYSEHDANFYNLQKQLNEEAASLDWTKSSSHTLSGIMHSEHHEEHCIEQSSNFSRKLGGEITHQLASTRASSVAAAYQRSRRPEIHQEPDPDYSEPLGEADFTGSGMVGKLNAQSENRQQQKGEHELDVKCVLFSSTVEGLLEKVSEEPGPDDSELLLSSELQFRRTASEPDPDDSETMEGGGSLNMEEEAKLQSSYEESGPVCYQENDAQGGPESGGFSADGVLHAKSNADGSMFCPVGPSKMHIDELDLNDQELRVIQDPVTVLCNRLMKAIDMLWAEVDPTEASGVFQTLFKIIRNLIEHPEEIKFQKLRKANPTLRSKIANYKAAMEILFLVGFNEDAVLDEIGKAETYLVLKRNDPGLLWLAKSSLETCIAC